MENCNLHLSNLSKAQVHLVVSEVLDMDQSHIVDLSNIVFNKTLGFPISIVQYLRLLKSKSQLYSKKGSWECNLSGIVENTSKPKLSIIMEWVHLLESVLRDGLMMASCIGFKFSLELLTSILVAE